MALKLSKRSDIESFRVLENLRAVNEKIAKGADIIRLEAGQPCFGAPEPALQYVREMTKNDPIQGYTDALGMTLLRDRIAAHYGETYDVDLHFENIGLGAGSSTCLVLTFLSAFEAGDKIGIVIPAYAPYRNILQSMDLEVVPIHADAKTNYQPTADMLEPYAGKISGLIINSPANPTGTCIDNAELEKICQWCADNNVRLVSDEAYHGITYEEKAQTARKYNRDAIVVNTFSKYFALTGWRLGWVVMPDDMKQRYKCLAENLFVSPPTISQHLAYKVFDHKDVLDSYIGKYKTNRDILRAGLPDAGIKNLSQANGAFYIYADVKDLTNDSEEFCRQMVDEAGVSCTSGKDFDPTHGHETIRISYAGSADDMHEACKRIKAWLGK